MSCLSPNGTLRRSSLYVLDRCSSSSDWSTFNTPDFGGSSNDFPNLYGSLKKICLARLLSYFLILAFSARRRSLARLLTSLHSSASSSFSLSSASFQRRRSTFFSFLRIVSSLCLLDGFGSLWSLICLGPNLKYICKLIVITNVILKIYEELNYFISLIHITWITKQDVDKLLKCNDVTKFEKVEAVNILKYGKSKETSFGMHHRFIRVRTDDQNCVQFKGWTGAVSNILQITDTVDVLSCWRLNRKNFQRWHNLSKTLMATN